MKKETVLFFSRCYKILLLTFLSFSILGCSHYVRFMIVENKLKPTPYNVPDHKPNPRLWRNDKITFTLIGHSTVLINFYGTTILTDPVLLKRIGPPELWNNYFGVRRIMKMPSKIEELPKIDIILISHAHYEHLCLASLKKIYSLQKEHPVVVIPEHTKHLIKKIGFTKIHELHWSENKGQNSLEVNNIFIKAFQIEHRSHINYGGREKAKRSNGYSISSGSKRIVFIGDSAYRRYRGENRTLLNPPLAINWKERVNPGISGFDLCIIPIGDYHYRVNHMDPQDALELLTQIGGRKMLPIHYDTFILTDPSQENPKTVLLNLLKENVSIVQFETLDGEISFPDIGVECLL